MRRRGGSLILRVRRPTATLDQMAGATPLAAATPLPGPPDGWFDYDYRVLMDGRLALVRTRIDIHGIWRNWWATGAATDPLGDSVARPDFWSATEDDWRVWYQALDAAYWTRERRPFPALPEDDVRLSVFDGAGESDVVVMRCGYPTQVDRMVDGRWLVVSSRPRSSAAQNHDDARLYSPDGAEVSPMHLGAGIRTLLCSPDGTIWVGYGEETVHDGPNGDGTWPVSTGGVVQFDPTGGVRWSFNQHAPDRGDHGIYISDCPPMTLSGSTFWALMPNRNGLAAEEPAMLLTNVEQGVVSLLPCPTGYGREIAISAGALIVAGFNWDSANRILAGEVRDGTVQPLGRIRVDAVARAGWPMIQWPNRLLRFLFDFDPASGSSARRLQGRDGVLHAIGDGLWYRVSATDAAMAADPSDVSPTCTAGLGGGWTIYAPQPSR